MKQNYKKILIIVSVLLVIGILIILFIKYKETKVNWDQSITNYITLEDNNSNISGNGVSINNNTININYSGIYELTGTLTNGKIIVNIKDKGNVKLIFNNVDITSNTYALYIENTKSTSIVLNEDTINKLRDTNKEREEDGVIYSKDDLVIEGTGTLEINSSYQDGIVSKDTLTIKSGTYIINSIDDGIRGKDYIEINNGIFTINSEGDAFKSTNTDDTSLGYITIDNGIFNIECDGDFIDSETALTINNGVFDITTGGGSINSSSNSMGMWSRNNINTNDDVSSKGIKATNITINNGEFNIDSSDDAIHSNGTLKILNGTYDISSGDDGIHADTSIDISDGEFNIDKSYEGIESTNITINNGEFHITSSDDGINIAGGNDGSSMGRPGANNINNSTNQYLVINDGYVYVDSTGDGLDANGGIKINGGIVIVNGPTNDGNGSLDYDYDCIVNGGTLITAGSSGMLQTPSTNSELYTLSIVFDENVDSIINISDESGNEVLTFKPSKTIKSLVVTSTLLKSGSTYNIYTNGTYSGTEIDGIYKDGTYMGTLYKSVTITSKVTSTGSSGGMNNIMLGGMRR